MKSFLAGLVGLIILGLAAPVKADQLPLGDPHVKTGGGLPSAFQSASNFAFAPAPAPIIVQSFTIESPSGTSPGTSPCKLMEGGITLVTPQCLFENDIAVNGVGETITSLVFDAPGIDPSTVNCGFLAGSPFSMCGVDPLTGGGSQITFFDGSVPYHSDFTLDFEGFPANFSFPSQASASPEPGTVVLIFGGLSALLARRRLRAK